MALCAVLNPRPAPPCMPPRRCVRNIDATGGHMAPSATTAGQQRSPVLQSRGACRAPMPRHPDTSTGLPQQRRHLYEEPPASMASPHARLAVGRQEWQLQPARPRAPWRLFGVAAGWVKKGLVSVISLRMGRPQVQRQSACHVSCYMLAARSTMWQAALRMRPSAGPRLQPVPAVAERLPSADGAEHGFQSF